MDAYPETMPYRPSTRDELEYGLRHRFDRPYIVDRRIEEGKDDLSKSCPRIFHEIMHGAGDELILVRRYNSKIGVTYLFLKFSSNSLTNVSNS